MNEVGIEKINIYGSSLCMSQMDLARARDKDPERVLNDFHIDTRSLNPPYEDTVTMGANAAQQMLTDEDKEQIGLLIVGTEGSVDFGKPISTNIHRALGLPANVRNFETKFACYSAVAALDCAINWIASGLNNGKKALVIASDFSRKHFHKDHEFVLGGSAAAVLVSNTPEVVEYETRLRGTWTHDEYDTFRPTAREEMGNNEVSLYSYQDAIEGAYGQYLERIGKDSVEDDYFNWHVYHMPFPGMALLGHRTVCKINGMRKKSQIQESFDRKVLPSLSFAKRVGSTYGGSNFVGLCGLIMHGDVKPDDRIGFFSYGSGYLGEFYSARVCPEAKEIVAAMKIEEKLDARKMVSVAEYEAIEIQRDAHVEARDFVTDLTVADNWFDRYYRSKGLLYLKEVKDFYRIYEWS